MGSKWQIIVTIFEDYSLIVVAVLATLVFFGAYRWYQKRLKNNESTINMKLHIFRKQKITTYLGEDIKFSRTLTAFDLMAMGIGAVIGTGIFILPGTVAATTAGPGVSLSFLVAAVICVLAGMCYAEFASSIPVAGSAYSYGNIIYGEFIGWLMGWALILEYMLAVATVAAGWSSYFTAFLLA